MLDVDIYTRCGGSQGVEMDVSRGTAYGVCVSQCALTLAVILFCPRVDVDVYAVQGHINSTTRGLSVDPVSDFKGLRVFMAMPLMLSSLMAAFFSTVTYRAYEQGFADHDYQQEVMSEVGLWDLLFWVYCILAHAVVVFIISDPVDIFGALSSVSFMVYFLYRACAPKGPNLSLTQENINILFYCLGVSQMAYQLTDTRGNGATIIMLLVVLDYFLGVGHTYDRQATLDTVANCRLFYVCVASVSLACLYALCDEGSGASESLIVQ